MTEFFSVLAELSEGFSKIEEVDIRRVQRRLGKVEPNEKPLGTLHDANVKKLWALAEKYEGIASHHGDEARFNADSDEQQAESEQRAQRAAALEALARNLFWIQAKDEMGPAGWAAERVGLRADWLLVVAEKKKPA